MRYTIHMNEKSGKYYVVDNSSISGLSCKATGPYRNKEEAEEAAQCYNMAGVVIS